MKKNTANAAADAAALTMQEPESYANENAALLQAHPELSPDQAALLAWYEKNKRDLPFRKTRDPYCIWISEIMAQQTRIEAMLPYYDRFLARYPDVPSLAAAEDEELMKLWQGLGYYSRARNLKKAARQCMELHQGKLPASFSGLRKLAGIGDYTAGAVASIAYGERVPAIDGNVVRVYSRILHETGETDRTPVKKRLEQAVRAELPAESFMPFWNQALMELGASICLPKVPKCTLCPWQNRCLAAKAGDAPSLPRKKPKKQRIQDKKTFYVTAAVHNGQWYIELEKQPENGLLASLYLFSAEKPDVVYESIPLQPAKHVFTHREWLMDGFLVISRYHEDMISLEALEKEKALPSAMRPFYQQMKQLLSLREDLLKEESRNTGIQADPAQN